MGLGMVGPSECRTSRWLRELHKRPAHAFCPYLRPLLGGGFRG